MKPGASEEYSKEQANDVEIYFHSKVKTSNEVKFQMSEKVSDLPNKEIEVKGIEVT